MSNVKNKRSSAEVATELASHIKGKIILITGCSPGGLGAAAAFAIAPHNPGLLILTGRSRAKIIETENAIKRISPNVKTRIAIFDLHSLKSVRKGALEINSYSETIDVIINNAAIMATPFEKTDDGFESQFGVNHVAHFLLTNLLLGKMLKNNGGTIVNVTSGASYGMGNATVEDPNYEMTPYEKWNAYSRSKAANALFSIALAQRLGSKGIYSYACEPNGAVLTNLSRHLTPEDWDLIASLKVELVPIETAVIDYLLCAFDPSLHENNGIFMTKSEINLLEEFPWVRGIENSEQLWSLSEKLVQQKFSY